MYVFRRLLSNRVILIYHIIKRGATGVDQNMIFDDKGGGGGPERLKIV